MAAVRRAAAKTKRSARTALRGDRGGARASLRPAQHPLAGARAGAMRGRGLTHLPLAPVPLGPARTSLRPQTSLRPRPKPLSYRAPGNPSTALQVCAGVLACIFPRVGGQGVRGVGTPARHLPSSLSSTIISGAPCPAQLGSAGRRAPTLGALRRGSRSSGSKRALITRLSGS